jgi:non-ribosomal peptide synthetase component F
MGSIPQLSVIKGKQSHLQPRLLHRVFEDQVDKVCGNNTALIYSDDGVDERRTNYFTLNSSANRMASTLLHVIQSQQLQCNNDGDWIIAVCMRPSDNLVATLLAIWKCGGTLRSDFKFM